MVAAGTGIQGALSAPGWYDGDDGEDDSGGDGDDGEDDGGIGDDGDGDGGGGAGW